MREIRLLVTLQVDECEPEKPVPQATMELAATEAVSNVLEHAQGIGFPHHWENELSIQVAAVSLYNG